jgi:lipopolysaccharide export system permease protein
VERSGQRDGNVVQRVGQLLPPVLSRHLLREFLLMGGLCLAAFLAIALIVDFFDRFDSFLKHGAPAGAIVRYFVFKLPLVVTQVVPVAVLAGILIGLGGLSHRNEFIALRAAGVSIWQVAAPILAVAAVISGLVFLWNEQVVPYCSERSHDIEAAEIKKRPLKGVAGQQHVWYRGLTGFYNIDHVDARQRTLYGLTVYQVGEAFRLNRVIEIDRAMWENGTWTFSGGRAYTVSPNGEISSGSLATFRLPESPNDFDVGQREPEEFSYAELRRHLHDLRRRGADPSEYLVDLHLKLAIPLISLVMAVIAVPLATRGSRTRSVASAVGLGLLIGFAYWVVLAFARALGQSSALPPPVAAWAANGIFSLVGLFLLLDAD